MDGNPLARVRISEYGQGHALVLRVSERSAAPTGPAIKVSRAEARTDGWRFVLVTAECLHKIQPLESLVALVDIERAT